MRTHKLLFQIPILAALASGALALAACSGTSPGVVSAEGSSGASTGGSTSSSSTSTTVTTPPSTQTGSEATVAISGSPSTTATVGSEYDFKPTLTKGGGTVTFSISGKPQWATFSTATGALSGTPGAGEEGMSAVITISASNGSSSAELAPFTIQVNAPGTPSMGSATLSWNAPVTNTNGTEIRGLAGYHIYYGTNKASLNHTITIAIPTETVYTVEALAPGTYYFSVVAYNAMGVDSPDSNIASKTIT